MTTTERVPESPDAHSMASPLRPEVQPRPLRVHLGCHPVRRPVESAGAVEAAE